MESLILIMLGREWQAAGFGQLFCVVKVASHLFICQHITGKSDPLAPLDISR
jgi:hypothetical protein